MARSVPLSWEHVKYAVLVVLSCGALAGQSQDLSSILASELNRNFQVLKEKGDPPAYYLAYTVTEVESEVVAANAGSLQSQNRNHTRLLDVTVRLGSPELDNYRSVRGQRTQFTSGAQIALVDDPLAIQRRVWLETDRVYRAASQRLMQVKTDEKIKAAVVSTAPDFSAEQPSTFSAPPAKLKFNAAEWTQRLRKLSREFAKYPAVLNSGLNVTAQRESKTMVNTEGTRIAHGRLFSRVSIFARAKAADGMDLVTTHSFESEDPSGLPKDSEIAAGIEKVSTELTSMLRASPVDPYVGPAILSGSAAGVFFHEIFGHRVEGHRQKDESDGQTFTKSVGRPVLPDFLSVIFDPTQNKAAGTDLFGAYSYDDEGVKARRTPVVENGVLKGFLMSRSPIPAFSNSNGHGRRQPGAEVVARQSNLFVESKKTVSDARLREMLKEEIKRQNKPWGLYFAQVTGGFTTTGRTGLQAFTVIPLVVYKVFADDRPDEIVRGVDIVGTPLASFAKIVATGDKPAVFNGYCGAESGNVPVSAISPAVLVSEIEVQRKPSPQESRPYLPRPETQGSQQ